MTAVARSCLLGGSWGGATARTGAIVTTTTTAATTAAAAGPGRADDADGGGEGRGGGHRTGPPPPLAIVEQRPHACRQVAAIGHAQHRRGRGEAARQQYQLIGVVGAIGGPHYRVVTRTFRFEAERAPGD